MSLSNLWDELYTLKTVQECTVQIRNVLLSFESRKGMKHFVPCANPIPHFVSGCNTDCLELALEQVCLSDYLQTRFNGAP